MKSCPRWLFRGIGPFGKEGVIAEHPTLKLKYHDAEMAKLAAELKEKLALERKEREIDGDIVTKRNGELEYE